MAVDGGARARQVGPEEQLFLLRLLARASGEATDLHATLEAVLHAVCHATGWLVGQAWLPAQAGAALECCAAWYASSPNVERLRPVLAGRALRSGEGLAGTAWATGQSQWAADGRSMPAEVRAYGLTTGVAVPVWGDHDVVGVLEFFGRHTQPEDERLQSLLLVIAAQVGALLQRSRLLQELQEQSRRLRELSRLKADFTAMVAHELGGPLAAIRGQAETLASGGLDADGQRAAVRTILTEARLLTSLVEDVQRTATAESDDFAVRITPVRLGRLLADAAASARNLAGRHPLSVASVSDDLRVWADAERIGQVLRNLLDNAAKHSPPGTPIVLRAVSTGASVRVEVADQGFGIRPEDFTRIFEKFGRGRTPGGRRVPGAGLGLYLSRRIIRAHGSELTVTSTPGQGAVFGFGLEPAP